MHRARLMILLVVVGAGLPARALDLAELAGDTWYGLYMNGDKVGYALERTVVREDGAVVMSQDASFKLNMVGMKQSMRMVSERVYGPDGALVRVTETVDDISGTNTFLATVEGDQVRLRAGLGGAQKDVLLPKPSETLADALRTLEWIRSNPVVGAETSYSLFEPMFQEELVATSEVVGIETRLLDGVSTRVFELKTTMSAMGMTSVSYVSESGDLLEDRIAGGLIVMRLEPEKVAKDVTYRNDTIVSNAALVDRRIPNPRRREALRLKLDGPLEEHHLIEDGRQSIRPGGGSYVFEGRLLDAAKLRSVQLPIEGVELDPWLEPSMFVQSDHPDLVAKAREIVGDETDALKVSETLVRWVHDNMRSTFSARLTNSLEVLDSMEGDCTEHSMLYIGLARAAGLPAREVAGLIYVDAPEPGFYFHQWAKVWIGEWIDVDPTFGQPVADATHIKLVEGDILEQTKLLPVIGQLEIEVLYGP